MSALFTPIPRFCKCGASRVDTSDTASATYRAVAVHGLMHCFVYARQSAHAPSVMSEEVAAGAAA